MQRRLIHDQLAAVVIGPVRHRPLDARTAGRAPEAGGKVAHPAIVPLRNRQQRCGFGPSVGYAFATGTRDW